MPFLSAIDRYVFRLIFTPLMGALVIAAMLLVLDRIQRLFDFVINEGGPVGVVWRMLVNLLPEYLSLGIPIALMMGILLAFRKLAASSELDVLQAVGKGYPALLKVPYLYAIALALLNLFIVGYVQPTARYAYEQLRFELRSGALGASIKTGEFTDLGPNLAMRIEESHDNGSRLGGIFIYAQQKDGQSLAATAKAGRFFATDDPDKIILRLTDGVLVHDSPRFNTPRTLTFASHDVPIPLPRFEKFRGRGRKDNELTIPELVRVGGNKALARETRLESRANFHYRIVEIASMFVIPLIALALAVPPKRSSSALGVFLSIILLVTQHKVNEYMESVASRGGINPVLALWGPFALFAALGIWMFWTLAFVPGGQPIGTLDRWFGKLGAVVAGWFRRRRRTVGA